MTESENIVFAAGASAAPAGELTTRTQHLLVWWGGISFSHCPPLKVFRVTILGIFGASIKPPPSDLQDTLRPLGVWSGMGDYFLGIINYKSEGAVCIGGESL